MLCTQKLGFPQPCFFLDLSHPLLDFLVPVPGLRIVMRNYRSPGLLAPLHPVPTSHLWACLSPQPSVPDCSCLFLDTDSKICGGLLRVSQQIKSTLSVLAFSHKFKKKIRFEPIPCHPAEVCVVFPFLRWSHCISAGCAAWHGRATFLLPVLSGQGWCWD